MITIISIVTSVKDYVEIVHQLIDAELTPKGMINTYNELGPLITYVFLSLKSIFYNIISLNWLKNISNLPIIIPDISSSLLSEISILDGGFNNILNVSIFDKSYQENNILISSLQKFSIGLINSLFIWLPTSTAHIITLRRFVMQGLEAGYMAGLGTLAGSILWITCIIFGCRFVVIPWLSLDIFRYCLGFLILVKYMWDSYNERRIILEDLSKQKIFLLNFLLALTEQTSIYPFFTNLSIGPETSIIENFPSTNYVEFLSIHGWYVGGLILGSLSLLNFTCWFIEFYGFNIYMWFLGSFQVSTGFYYKLFHFIFLYLTMFCAISSIPYYGLDYTISNPLGYVPQDRITNQKLVRETAFLDGKASDRNTRKNRGRHGRTEKWKRRVRQFRAFDASLYDQGTYDLFTIEDLNYGFDKFWSRRKMRNHRARFRFFPGDMMRSFKKELSKTRLESYSGPRLEFFRGLFEQVYEPIFHEYSKDKRKKSPTKTVASLPPPPGGGYGCENGQSWSPPGTTPEGLQGGSCLNGKTKDAFYINLAGLNRGLIARGDTAHTNTKTLILAGAPLAYGSAIRGGQDIRDTLPPPPGNMGGKSSFMGKAHKSMLRKFIRKTDARIKGAEIKNKSFLKGGFKNILTPLIGFENKTNLENGLWLSSGLRPESYKPQGAIKGTLKNTKIYSKRWKEIFSKLNHNYPPGVDNLNPGQQIRPSHLKKGGHARFTPRTTPGGLLGWPMGKTAGGSVSFIKNKKENSQENMSQKDRDILNYRSILLSLNPENNPPPLGEGGKETNLKSGHTILGTLRDYTFINKFHSKVLLHPMKFYLQKQQAFERKLRYYTPTVFRKFSAGNNASYFRVMMKRHFYYYKPDLRWERTLKVSSLRKALRKTKRLPKKLLKNMGTNQLRGLGSDQATKPFKGYSPRGWPLRGSYSSPQGYASYTNPSQGSMNLPTPTFFDRIQKPTHDYSVVGKRISRYRFQIYKDVLQHWYYSPMNRLLLKFDVDSFIKRQPKSHFLTRNEENLLHLRRFLLSEHYNTLRWYTSIEHYRAMKVKIGGTKSFASRTYNQQFQGTFKKIRHLFAITATPQGGASQVAPPPGGGISLVGQNKTNAPASINPFRKGQGISNSPGGYTLPPYSKNKDKSNNSLFKSGFGAPPRGGKVEPPILKFDQPLINESPNNGLKHFQTKLILHEELLNELVTPKKERSSLKLSLGSEQAYNPSSPSGLLPEPGPPDINPSGVSLGGLWPQANNRAHPQGGYRGVVGGVIKPAGVSWEPPLNPLNPDIKPFKGAVLTVKPTPLAPQNNTFKNFLKEKLNLQFKQQLYFNLLKSWKRKVNNQKSLRTYLEARREKLIRRKQKKQIYLKEHLSQFNKINKARAKNLNPGATPRGGYNLMSSATATHSNPRGVAGGVLAGKMPRDNQKITTGLQKAIIDAIFNLTSLQTFTSILPSLKQNSFLKERLNYQVLLKEEQNLKNSINILAQLVPENKIDRKNYQQHIFSYFNPTEFFGAGGRSKLVTNWSKREKDWLKKKKEKDWSKKEIKLSKQRRLRKELKKTYAKHRILVARGKPGPPVFPLKNWKGPSKRRNTPTPLKQTSKIPLNLAELSLSEGPILGLEEYADSTDSTDSTNSSYFYDPLQNRNSFINSARHLLNFISPWEILKKPYKLIKNPGRRMQNLRSRGIVKKRILGDGDTYTNKYKSLGGRAQDSFSQNLAPPLGGPKLSLHAALRHNGAAVKRLLLKEKKEKNLFMGEAHSLINRTFLKKDRLFSLNTLKLNRSISRKQRFWKERRSSHTSKRRQYKKGHSKVLIKLSLSNEKLKKTKLKYEFEAWWFKKLLPDLKVASYSSGPSSAKLTDGIGQLNNKLWRLYKSTLNTPVYSTPPQGGGGNNGALVAKSTQPGRGIRPSFIAKAIAPTFFKKGQGFVILQTNIWQKVHESNFQSNFSLLASPKNSTFMVNTNPIPFYVGWDESLRQFIITNRFLSRRESGYSFQNPENPFIEDFTLAPLKGMNALTTLTWITPFTTYDPDQFFVLGLDGFAPLNWRKFKFRHTILKTWLYQTNPPWGGGQNGVNLSNPENNTSNPGINYVNGKAISHRANNRAHPQGGYRGVAGGVLGEMPREMPILIKKKIFISKEDHPENNPREVAGVALLKEGWQLNKNLLDKIKEKNYPSGPPSAPPLGVAPGELVLFNQNSGMGRAHTTAGQDTTNQYISNPIKSGVRRLKKRYRRVIKYPRVPVSIPSGPLVNEVLPIHYISAFYKRSRLPRDRYLKRKFAFGPIPLVKTINSVSGPLVDFTIRKRVKPTRKYHTKNTSNQHWSQGGVVIIPRRLKFLMDSAGPPQGGNNSTTKNQSPLGAFCWRPFSQRTLALTQASLKNKKSINGRSPLIEEIIKEQLNASRLKNKKTRYFKKKQTADSLRARRLKRRTFRQTIRTQIAYSPQSGGIVWPGDYLKNEFVEAPLLETPNSFKENKSLNITSTLDSEAIQTRKIAPVISKKKTPKSINAWEIQPKKYLLEKHNIKIIKKKLEKAYRSHKLKEKVALGFF